MGKMVSGAHPKELKAFIDDIMPNFGSGVIALCSDKDNKASIVVSVSKDLINKYNAVDLVRAAAAIVNGNGGSDITKINEALQKIKSLI